MYVIKDFMSAVFVTLLICTVVKSDDEVIEESKNCTEPVIINVSQDGIGSFGKEIEESCDIYIYQIKSLTKSSIIKIRSTFTDYSNLNNSKGADRRQIQVVLKEFATLSDGNKSLIVANEWSIDSQDASLTGERIFFSRTADLTVNVAIKGNWSQSDFDLEFFYEEVEFGEYRKSSKDREGEISPWISMEGRGYRPNSVYVFQILKSDDMNASNIDLELKKLQIDEGIGEYLLIGAGKDVFQGPPPLFISNLQSKKKIKIFDENAYIVLVAASTRFNYRGFEITWRYNGTRIDRKEEKIVEDRMKKLTEESSMPICIFNSSAALNEINKEDSFSRFREQLASLATEYYPMVYEGKRMNIDSSQVHIVRVSGFIKEGKEEGLYVMVNIQHKDGRAVFNWEKMGHVLQKYSSLSNSSVAHGYRIKECPQKAAPESKWPLYLIAPLICCFFLLIWNWKYTPFSRIFSRRIERDIIRSSVHMVPLEENEYVVNPETSTSPKLYITDDLGRRNTYHDNVLSSDPEQDSEVEIFNQTHVKRSHSSRSNPNESRSPRSSTRPKMSPEINRAFVLNEEYTDEVQNTPNASASVAENLYDSVGSHKGLLSKYVTEESKL